MNRTGHLVLRLLLPVLFGALAGAGRAADPVAPLVLERTIPLAGVTGRIDHMAVDLARKRLIVAELGNGTVDVIDFESGKTVHRFDRLRDPQGIGYAPKSDVIAVALHRRKHRRHRRMSRFPIARHQSARRAEPVLAARETPPQ